MIYTLQIAMDCTSKGQDSNCDNRLNIWLMLRTRPPQDGDTHQPNY